MKNWSIRVATIAGTEVRIHLTFLLLLGWVGWVAYSQGGPALALDSVGFIASIFLCVLLHEFGHVAAARRYGIRTPDITLLPIGGLARLERMPRNPREEFVVALCGPLVNVVIALLLFAFLHAAPTLNLEFDPLKGSFAERLLQWNLLMVAFNMIPAFPMDGGRVLRALLAMKLDYGQATRVAASIGQGLAALGFFIAFFAFHPILLLIALFIYMSAGQEAAMVGEEEAIRGLTVAQAMVTDFHALPDSACLGDAVEVLLKGSQHDFPVLDSSGRLAGLLTRTALIGALAKHGKGHPVRDVIEPAGTSLDPGTALSVAVQTLRASPLPALPVMDSKGGLAGLLTTENVGEMLMVRAALLQGGLHSRQAGS
jgi:Zn-dependent protease/CBS domain-containing protein